MNPWWGQPRAGSRRSPTRLVTKRSGGRWERAHHGPGPVERPLHEPGAPRPGQHRLLPGGAAELVAPDGEPGLRLQGRRLEVVGAAPGRTAELVPRPVHRRRGAAE